MTQLFGTLPTAANYSNWINRLHATQQSYYWL